MMYKRNFLLFFVTINLFVSCVLACFESRGIDSKCIDSQFKDETTYKYKYTAEFNSTFVAFDKPSTYFKINCEEVLITKAGPCIFKLQTKECGLTGWNSENPAVPLIFKEQMRKPVLFKVTRDAASDVIAWGDDTTVDIKKGLISVLFENWKSDENSPRRCERSETPGPSHKIICTQNITSPKYFFLRSFYEIRIGIRQELVYESSARATESQTSTSDPCQKLKQQTSMDFIDTDEKSISSVLPKITPTQLPDYESLEGFIELTKNIELASHDELLPYVQSWWNCSRTNKCTADKQNLVRQHLKDGLITCKTIACKNILLVLEAKENKKVEGVIDLTLVDLLLNREVNGDTALLVWDICSTSRSKRCWLLFSSILNKAFKNNVDDFTTIAKFESLRNAIQNEISAALQSNSRAKIDTITAIQICGNLGELMNTFSTPFSQSLLDLLKTNKALRPVLLKALSKFPSNDIKTALLEIVLDEKEDHIFRIRAYKTIYKTLVVDDFVQILTKNIKWRANRHVRYYIARHLSDIAYETNDDLRLKKVILAAVSKSGRSISMGNPYGAVSLYFHVANELELPMIGKRRVHATGSVLYEKDKSAPSVVEVELSYESTSSRDRVNIASLVLEGQGGSLAEFFNSKVVSTTIKNFLRNKYPDSLGDQLLKSLLNMDNIFKQASSNIVISLGINGYEMLHFDSKKTQSKTNLINLLPFDIASIMKNKELEFRKFFKIFDWEKKIITSAGVVVKSEQSIFGGFGAIGKLVDNNLLSYFYSSLKNHDFIFKLGGALKYKNTMKIDIAGLHVTGASGEFSVENLLDIEGSVDTKNLAVKIKNPGTTTIMRVRKKQEAFGKRKTMRSDGFGKFLCAESTTHLIGFSICAGERGEDNSVLISRTKHWSFRPSQSIKFFHLGVDRSMTKDQKKLAIKYSTVTGETMKDIAELKFQFATDNSNFLIEYNQFFDTKISAKFEYDGYDNIENYGHKITAYWGNIDKKYFSFVYKRNKKRPPMNSSHLASLAIFPAYVYIDIKLLNMQLILDGDTEHDFDNSMDTRLKFKYLCEEKVPMTCIFGPTLNSFAKGNVRIFVKTDPKNVVAGFEIIYPSIGSNKGNHILFNTSYMFVTPLNDRNASVRLEWTGKEGHQVSSGIEFYARKVRHHLERSRIFIYSPKFGWEFTSKASRLGSWEIPIFKLEAKNYKRDDAGQWEISGRRVTFDHKSSDEEEDVCEYFTSTTNDLPIDKNFVVAHVNKHFNQRNDGKRQQFRLKIVDDDELTSETILCLFRKIRWRPFSFVYYSNIPSVPTKAIGYATFDISFHLDEYMKQNSRVHIFDYELLSSAVWTKKKYEHNFTSPALNFNMEITESKTNSGSFRPRHPDFDVKINSKSPIEFLNYEYKDTFGFSRYLRYIDLPLFCKNCTLKHPFLQYSAKREREIDRGIHELQSNITKLLGYQSPTPINFSAALNIKKLTLDASILQPKMNVFFRTNASDPSVRTVTVFQVTDGESTDSFTGSVSAWGSGKYNISYNLTPTGKQYLKDVWISISHIALTWVKQAWYDLEQYSWQTKTNVDQQKFGELLNTVSMKVWSRVKDKCSKFVLCKSFADNWFYQLSNLQKTDLVRKPGNQAKTSTFKNVLSYILKRLVDYKRFKPINGKYGAVLTLPIHWQKYEDRPILFPHTSAFLKRLRARAPLKSLQGRIFSKKLPKTSAIIFGSKYMYTFDGWLYENNGFTNDDCVYILSKDFVSKDFTLLGSRKSKILITPSITVSIDRRNRVKINGNSSFSHLPYRSPDGSIHIYSNGPLLHLLFSKVLNVICDKHNDLCYVTVNEDYFSSLQGLLGTNDGKLASEKMNLNNVLSDNVNDFLNSYEVSKLPICQPYAVQNTMTGNPNPVCGNLFGDSNSVFKPCFNTVNPNNFYSMCQKATAQFGYSTKKTLCTIGAGYIAACKLKGVMIPFDKACSSCEEQYNVGEKWSPKIKKSADILFVISKQRINSTDRHPSEFIKLLMNQISHDLINVGLFSDVRFGIVGFGGTERYGQPHAHLTKENKMFASKEELTESLGTMSYEGNAYISKDYTLDALRFAADYPFRINSTRSVIVITPYEASNMPEKSKIRHLLRANSITLSSVSDYTELSRRYIDGMNWNLKVLSQNKRHHGTTPGISFPQGVYAKLAQSLDGAVFDIKKLRSKTNEDIILSIAEQIESQLSPQPEWCRECECVQGSSGEGISRCGWKQC